MVGLGTEVPNYPVYLLESIVIWTFFAETTARVGALPRGPREPAAQDPLPAPGHPARRSLTSLFNLALNLIAVVVFALASGVTPTVGWLELPFLVLILICPGDRVSMLLSALFVRFRDLQPIWDVALQVLFYGSPILFVAAKYPDNIERIAMANPLACVLTQMRKAFIEPSAPSAAEMIGGPVRLLIPFGDRRRGRSRSGYWVFSREAPRIAENL